MRRMFWMAVGAGAAVWGMNKANQLVRGLTPGSLAETAALGAAEAGGAARGFLAEVRAGMLQRELELNRQLGLDGSVLSAPVPPQAQVLRATALRPQLPGSSTTHPNLTNDNPNNRNEDPHGVG